MMLTTIKACCGHCGREISMYSTAYHLTIYSHTGRGFYTFFCTACHQENSQVADEHIVSLLQSGGVRYTVIKVPAEALECHRGPTITYDDVMDFMIDVRDANSDLCDRLAKSARGESNARNTA